MCNISGGLSREYKPRDFEVEVEVEMETELS